MIDKRINDKQIKGLRAFIYAGPSAQHVFRSNYLPNIYLSSLEASSDPPNLGEIMNSHNIYALQCIFTTGDALLNLFVYPSRL